MATVVHSPIEFTQWLPNACIALLTGKDVPGLPSASLGFLLHAGSAEESHLANANSPQTPCLVTG